MSASLGDGMLRISMGMRNIWGWQGDLPAKMHFIVRAASETGSQNRKPRFTGAGQSDQWEARF